MRSITLVACLLLSMSAFASEKTVSVWPTIFNYGNALQVQVYNTTESDITCSGSINAYLNDGRMQSFYFFESVMKGSFASRYYSVFGMNIRIVNYSHFINCYPR
jgi:hypothetical protein